MNSHWIITLFGKFLLGLFIFQVASIIFALFHLYLASNNRNSGDETDINSVNDSDFDSGNDSDFEDEIPKDKKNKIMPGARLRMMRR